MKFKIAVINGPNLNLLGRREVKIYGQKTLQDINRELQNLAKTLRVHLSFFQSNHEGFIIDHVQQARCDGILINPASLTHTSIALRDALLAMGKPFVEIHLSKIEKREKFRQHSFLTDIAVACISGLKEKSYHKGLKILADYLKNQ